MHKGRVSFVPLLAVAAVALTLTGCSRGTIMRVNGEKIGKDEFYERLQAVPVQTQQGAQPAGRYVVEQMIKEKLILQLAKDENVSPTDEQINKKLTYIKKSSGGDFERMLRNQGRSIQDWKNQQMLQQALTNVMIKDVDVPDSDVKAAYEKLLTSNPSPFKRAEQVFISVVITKAKAKIDKVYEKLNQGQEFGTVAMSMSEVPGAKQSQGMLDWISREDKRVPKAVCDAAFALEPTKYSKPFLVGKDQWIIVCANKRRSANVQSYAEVKDMLTEEMKMQKGSATGKFTERMQKFLQQSDITVKPERYKDIPDAMKKQAAKALEDEARKLPKIGDNSAPAPQPTQ